MSNIQLITNQLGTHLLKQIESASSICILTSFTMRSGVSFFAKYLKKAAERGADIKICTGDFIYILHSQKHLLLYYTSMKILKSVFGGAMGHLFILKLIYFKMIHMIAL